MIGVVCLSLDKYGIEISLRSKLRVFPFIVIQILGRFRPNFRLSDDT